MSSYFQYFKQPITTYELPKKFDYPFYYEPTEIAKQACKEVQKYLENQKDFEHNFGLENDLSSTPIGKMFGVLVVRNKKNEVGYLAAVSGKLANTNQHKIFVPPVFDMLNKNGFFLEQEERLNEINRILESLENNQNYLQLKEDFLQFEINSKLKIEEGKQLLKSNKKDRKSQRETISSTLSEEEIQFFEEDLVKQSLRDKHEFRVLSEKLDAEKQLLLNKINVFENEINSLKEERNLLLKQNSTGEELEILYQDDDLVVINKPEEFLSVPGIEIKDSVYLRIKHQFPLATGPIIVHRLDMSTSGILVLALNKESHKILQQQFIKRKVHKRYIALLEGNIEHDNGFIDLPLRVDLDDRPRQMVCYEHGKTAQTKYEVITRKDNKTLVYFYPITGRTHQLRMHASHRFGLNAPIIGDDLYGKKANRLHLHAESLEFTHPKTKELMKFQVEPNFNL